MIFRTSLSEEKHFALQSQSTSTHNDDITLLENQQRHIEAQPSLTGKYVNKTARSWVEARLDWRLQWFGATLIYILVVLVAYFTSYRNQYNSVIITTLKQNPALLTGVQTPVTHLPQILLLAECSSPSAEVNFTLLRFGITHSPYSQNDDIVPCDASSDQPQQIHVGPFTAYLIPLKGCALNCKCT